MGIRLIIDTSSLRAASGNREALQMIAELGRRGIVDLVMPEIVLREAASGIYEDAEQIRKRLRDVKAAATWALTLRDQLDRATTVIEKMLSAGEEELRSGLVGWVAESRGRVVRIDPAHAESVFDAYFSGRHPFKKRRSREDLPDGFILAAVATEAAVHETDVVVSDQRLRDGCQSIHNAVVHQSIGDFLRSSRIEGAIELYYQRLPDPEWLEAARAAVDRDFDELTEAIAYQVAQRVEFMEVHGDLLSDGHEAVVEDPGELMKLTVHGASLHRGLDQKVLFRVSAYFVDALLGLEIFKADYWSLSGQNRRQYSVADGDWNAHYLRAETYRSLRVELTAQVDIQRAKDFQFAAGVASIVSVDEVVVEPSARAEGPGSDDDADE